jgi:hypothetical protein
MRFMLYRIAEARKDGKIVISDPSLREFRYFAGA